MHTSRLGPTQRIETTFIHACLVFLSTTQRFSTPTRLNKPRLLLDYPETKLIFLVEVPLAVNVLILGGEKMHST